MSSVINNLPNFKHLLSSSKTTPTSAISTNNNLDMAEITLSLSAISTIFNLDMADIKTTYSYKPKAKFIGRDAELARLNKIAQSRTAQIIVVHGRRRVGKTTLIEEAFYKRSILKFEGLENRSDAEQRQHFLEQLSVYAADTKLAKLSTSSWKEVFMILAEYIRKGMYTVYLEELQWMANYKEALISDLKYVWDNYWAHNNELLLILCGSSPSFIINAVMHSRALYNRSQHEFAIQELSLESSHKLLGTKVSKNEALDAYLLVGGIPEYLHYLKSDSSIYLSLIKESFSKAGFFVNEESRVFVSSLAKSPLYRKTIELLAKNGPCTRKQLQQKMKVKSGGTLSSLFEDLERCGFISSYAPLAYGDTGRDSKFVLIDNYLHFFYYFIENRLKEIERGEFDSNPARAITHTSYKQWLGYSLERFCLKEHRRLAEILGFGAVAYQVGPFYIRGNKASGLQIDLMYKRKDKVLTICEIKYTEARPSRAIINQFEKKLELLPEHKRFTIQKVLISPNGASEELVNSGYFDRIVSLEQLL
jgi:predicted AAA+ superfamily ATPase